MENDKYLWPLNKKISIGITNHIRKDGTTLLIGVGNCGVLDVLIKKMDEVKTLNTFLLTKKGYEVTGVEGYVAIDKIKGNAVKLVDRMQFSYANFSPDVIKGWQR